MAVALAALALLAASDYYYPIPKVRPTLELTVGPKRDRAAPFVFHATGFLHTEGVENACRGRVSITFSRGARTVAAGRTKVFSDCTYSRRFTLATRKLTKKRRGRLRVNARFAGNTLLKPVSALPRTVRYGR